MCIIGEEEVQTLGAGQRRVERKEGHGAWQRPGSPAAELLVQSRGKVAHEAGAPGRCVHVCVWRRMCGRGGRVDVVTISRL